MSTPIIQMRNIEKHFGSVIALAGVSLDVLGEILFEGTPLAFSDPAAAIAAGIATVHQHLAMIPLMSVTRNFFMGNEPVKTNRGYCACCSFWCKGINSR